MSIRIDNTRAGRGKPRIDAPPVPANRKDRFTEGEAVSFIAERMSTYPTERAGNRKKVYEQIHDALEKNQLCGTKESISYSDLILWARSKSKLKNAVAGLDVVVGEIIDDHANAHDELLSLIFPASIEKCHGIINDLWSENLRLREQLSSAEVMLAAANSERNKAESVLKKQKLRQEEGRNSAAKQAKQNISRKPG